MSDLSFWILVGGAALAGVWLLVTYNGLVTLRQRARQATSDIDVQLKERHDLVPNLVETVKGYATHERGTLEAVVAARNGALQAGPGGKAEAEAGLSTALRGLLALSESYPDLKANANFQQLQEKLGEVEEKIARARRFLNNAAAEYNAAVESFPAVLVAKRLGFGAQAYWEPGEAERAAIQSAPSVRF